MRSSDGSIPRIGSRRLNDDSALVCSGWRNCLHRSRPGGRWSCSCERSSDCRVAGVWTRRLNNHGTFVGAGWWNRLDWSRSRRFRAGASMLTSNSHIARILGTGSLNDHGTRDNSRWRNRLDWRWARGWRTSSSVRSSDRHIPRVRARSLDDDGTWLCS